MIRNDLFGVAVITKITFSKIFRNLGLHADYIIGKLVTEEVENIQYQELSKAVNYQAVNELLGLLNDANKY